MRCRSATGNNVFGDGSTLQLTTLGGSVSTGCATTLQVGLAA